VGLYPERFGRFVERTNAFALECLKAQIRAADGRLDGIVIWGDIAVREFGRYPLQLGEYDIPDLD
jgi:hypothetical protein